MLKDALTGFAVDTAHAIGHLEYPANSRLNCYKGLISQGGAEDDVAPITPLVNVGTDCGRLLESTNGTLDTFVGMQASPPHSHSATYYGVVLSGALENPYGT